MQEVEKLVAKTMSKEFNEIELDELFELLIFLNFSLIILKENDIYDNSGITLKYKKHLPSLRVVQDIIQHCISKKQTEDKSTYENKLPSLIIYQLLHILAKT